MSIGSRGGYQTLRGVDTCTVKGCTRPWDCKELCTLHYRRLIRYGSTDFPGPSIVERYNAKIDKSAGTEECWIWTGTKIGRSEDKKYGVFKYETGSLAHRFGFELSNNVKLVSSIPIHHICGKTLCQQPLHLQATTPQENTAEMMERKSYLQRITALEKELARYKAIHEQCAHVL